MGEVVEFVPKALVDFEKSALKLIAATSRFMTDVPAALRVARAVKDGALLERIDALIYPLSALAVAINLLEDFAPAIVETVAPFEPVVLHVENAGETHNVSCHASVRENVVYINRVSFTQRHWIDRLTQTPPLLLIERK